MMRFPIAVVTALSVLALIAAGCGDDDDAGGGAAGGGASEETLRVALVLPDFTQNELILDQKNGAEAEAEKLGIELTTTGSGDAAEQARAVQNAVAAKVDAIVYNTIDAEALTPAIEEANAAGIPVICSNACAAGGENAAEITFDYKQMGEIMGEWLAEQVPSGGKVGIVDTNRADASVQQIYEGIDAGLAAGGSDPELVISPPTDWDAAKGLKVATDLLTANPDFDVLVCFHDLLLDACNQAMSATDYEDVPLSGLGGTCAGLAALLDGNAENTVAQFLYKAGSLGVAAAKAAVDGGDAESLSETAPMVGITSDSAKAMLDGSEQAPADTGLDEKLKSAEAGCK